MWITEEVDHDINYQGTTYTAEDNNAKCQAFVDETGFCHGTGTFEKENNSSEENDIVTVWMFKDEIVKVQNYYIADDEKERTWTCTTDNSDKPCSQQHGAYALTDPGSSSAGLRARIYKRDSLIAKDDDASEHLFYESTSDDTPYALNFGPYNAWCTYMHTIQEDKYCPSA